jgi:hypothetical protein
MPWDPEQDQYPDVKKIVRAVLAEEDFPEGDVDRLEITCLGNGMATWRVWAAKAEEPVGGTYENPEMPVEQPADSRLS